MSSSKFYRTNLQTDRQKRSELESGPPTKNSTGSVLKVCVMGGLGVWVVWVRGCVNLI